MELRIPLELLLSFHGKLYLPYGNSAFFREAMRDDDNCSAMKKIDHAVVHALVTRTEFIDLISEIVSLRSPSFMTQLF
jgi:hypothetical protein